MKYTQSNIANKTQWNTRKTSSTTKHKHLWFQTDYVDGRQFC